MKDKTMKIELEIPAGWRRVMDNEIIKDGDQYYWGNHWDLCCSTVGRTPKDPTNSKDIKMFITKKQEENMKKLAIYCPTPELSEAIQKMAFKEGWDWAFRGREKVQNYEYISLEENQILGTHTESYFKDHNYDIVNVGETERILKALKAKPEIRIKDKVVTFDKDGLTWDGIRISRAALLKLKAVYEDAELFEYHISIECGQGNVSIGCCKDIHEKTVKEIFKKL